MRAGIGHSINLFAAIAGRLPPQMVVRRSAFRLENAGLWTKLWPIGPLTSLAGRRPSILLWSPHELRILGSGVSAMDRLHRFR